jgi:hypothetical protein
MKITGIAVSAEVSFWSSRPFSSGLLRSKIKHAQEVLGDLLRCRLPVGEPSARFTGQGTAERQERALLDPGSDDAEFSHAELKR